MKLTKTILILLLVICIIGIAGCTSENNSYNNSNSINNQSSLIENNKTISTSANYEASGYCYNVVDGDTIDVESLQIFDLRHQKPVVFESVGRIRFVGVNTPERGQSGYSEAKDFVKSLCLHKTVNLDIDNAKHYDKYGRTLAVVYAGNTNVNAELLKRGYAEIMYIPPSEFDPYSWVGKSTSSNNNQVSAAGYYIGNKNSMKFHRPDCPSVDKMNEANKVRLNSREEAINKGYISCKYCNP